MESCRAVDERLAASLTVVGLGLTIAEGGTGVVGRGELNATDGGMGDLLMCEGTSGSDGRTGDTNMLSEAPVTS